jgi:hypothetical protein
MSDQPFTAQLAQLEQAARAARAEQRELEDQRDQAQQRAHDLRALLAARPASEFDSSGVPNPKTDARRLQGDIDAAADVLWSERIKAAGQRTRQARRAVDRFVHRHLVEIAEERYADDLQCVADLNAWLADGDQCIRNVTDRAQSWGQLLNAVQGLDIQRELPNYDGLNSLRKELRKQQGTTRPPVLMSIHPQDGETPNRVLVDGQWVPPDEPERRRRRDEERAEQQRRNDRLNERRRRVEFKFGPDDQPPPDASPLERMVHGLLG